MKKPKVKSKPKATAPVEKISWANERLEAIIAEMQKNIQDALSVEQRQEVINNLNEVLEELKA